MRLVSNGSLKDVHVLKHFKMGEGEYVLYRNNDGSVAIGSISEGKVLTPDNTIVPQLMKVLGNLISDTPNAEFNTQNNCELLNSSIVGNLQEIGYINVNIPPETINKLLGFGSSAVTNTIPETNTTTSTTQTPAKSIQDKKMLIYGIIIVVLIIILIFVIVK